MSLYADPTTHLLDIGGTVITYGTLDRDEPLGEIATPPTLGAASSILQQLAASWRSDEDVIVAVPGLITTNGFIRAALHSPLKGINLVHFLRANSRCGSIYVINDAKLQAYAFTGPERCHFHITLGTAVGGAFVNRRTVFGGSHGFAGEIGHVAVSSSTLHCPCGRIGCLDTLASGWSLERDLGRQWWLSPTASSQSRLAQAGNAVAEGLSTTVAILDISSFSIAGRITQNSHFIDPIRDLSAGLDQISAATCSWRAALLGARSLVLTQTQS